MDDRRQTLEVLRERVRRIESRRPSASVADRSVPGVEVENEFGRHVQLDVLWKRHGGFYLSRIEELPVEALAALSDGVIQSSDPKSWAFLDTETTGVMSGAGTCAFLIGIGRVTDHGFRVRQYVMRDPDEEPSMLYAVARELDDCEVLITYNGRTYDQPLLEFRYGAHRQQSPFGRLNHVDLLHGARRLWKLRFESCRLVELEHRILGFERENDVPGGAIPQLYFEYLHARRLSVLKGVLHHNALDILSLACLTAIVPQRFGENGGASLAHAGEMIGLGRWLHQQGRAEEAIALFERAMTRIEYDRVSAPRRLDLLIALAKHYERKLKHYSRALDMTLQALEIADKEEIRKRETRLRRKLGKLQRAPNSAD